MKPDDVRCIYIEGSGCYGRNGHEDAAADARTDREGDRAPGARPVDARGRAWLGSEGPADAARLQARRSTRRATSSAGNLQVFIPDRPKDIAVALLPAELAGLPTDPSHPGNIQASLAIPYTFPNIRATAHWLAETPFRPSWIRTPGRMQNTFGNESFIDEIVVAAGADPLEFRLKNLKDPRGAELLQALGELASWKPRKARVGNQRRHRARARRRLRQVRARAHVRRRQSPTSRSTSRPARSA